MVGYLRGGGGMGEVGGGTGLKMYTFIKKEIKLTPSLLIFKVGLRGNKNPEKKAPR